MRAHVHIRIFLYAPLRGENADASTTPIHHEHLKISSFPARIVSGAHRLIYLYRRPCHGLMVFCSFFVLRFSYRSFYVFLGSYVCVRGGATIATNQSSGSLYIDTYIHSEGEFLLDPVFYSSYMTSFFITCLVDFFRKQKKKKSLYSIVSSRYNINDFFLLLIKHIALNENRFSHFNITSKVS